MVTRIVAHPRMIVTLLSAAVGALVLTRHPFPVADPLIGLIQLERPDLWQALRVTYTIVCFSTPFVALSMLESLTYIFVASKHGHRVVPRLPKYPPPNAREVLSVVVGELHEAKEPVPVEEPRWLTIPERGLYTGVAVVGAVGSGKTSACMHPFAEQILAYRHADPTRRIGGVVLEVKGDFCAQVHGLLQRYGRGEDYVEISLDGRFCYNPLHNDLDAYASAYGLASLLNNLFGKGKEPFWQQAYTNLVKFIILLHKVLDDYVTLFDVYECAINADLLADKIREGERRFESAAYVSVTADTFIEREDLEAFAFQKDERTGHLRASVGHALRTHLDREGIPHTVLTDSGAEISPEQEHERRRAQFEAVRRWFYHDWKRIEPKLRTSIVEGISVFLSLFDDDPRVKRVFCPPKACYDAVRNADGRHGTPMPSFSDLIEQGKVCALNFPVAMNPGLARAIGTLMKQDFQRAVLNRIPGTAAEPGRHIRPVLFLADEYHVFATVGESDPSGDEKFFSLSRQARCIPIVATQSISSLRSTLPGETWRTLLQCFRTKIFLTLSDDYSARVASDLCGRDEQVKLLYNITETGQDARVSMLTGRTTAHKAAISASKSYSIQRDVAFEPKLFAELKNAQSIVLAYDGTDPQPPTYCYLKPSYLDPNTSYFEQVARGEL